MMMMMGLGVRAAWRMAKSEPEKIHDPRFMSVLTAHRRDPDSDMR
jgi:hypothetical protein